MSTTRHVLGLRLASAAIGLATAVALAGCDTGGEDTESIAFTVNRDGHQAIWVMDPDGRNRRPLTGPGEPGTDASGNAQPAWSPDRTQIAYSGSGEAREEDQDELEIYVMNSDGREKRRLTSDHALDATPAWSPDGRRIAFAHMTDFGKENADGVIVVMDPTGKGRVEITHHPDAPDIVLDSHPAWSPDGRLIAFTRLTYMPSSIEPRVDVFMVEKSGGGERLLIEDAAQARWSPDGSAIAFTSFRDRNGRTCFQECSPSGEIYVAHADGTGLRRLTTSDANDHSPAWSPDGRRILFVSDRSNRDEHENEIWVVGVDGGGLHRLTTNDVWDLEPAWR